MTDCRDDEQSPCAVDLSDPAALDSRIAGGKGANLAGMLRAGLNVPPGFVVPAGVFAHAVDANRLRSRVSAGDYAGARAVIGQARPPRAAIGDAYRRLGAGSVAVRSSAGAEDSRTASYAGQQETYLNVEGENAICARIIDCWSSFFSEHAVGYRKRKGSLEDLTLAVVVQRMVRSAKAGVLFTGDPVAGRLDVIVVEAVRGRGDRLVAGEATPDHYLLTREARILEQRLAENGVLGAAELQQLVKLGICLERHFGCPQDVEWAIADGEIYPLQSRPITTL